MPEIKFSHVYPKIHGQENAILLAVDCVPAKELDVDLVEYDTVYDGDKHYELPGGMVLILTFQGNKKIPFTTIRRSNASKYLYYKRQIGQPFYIVYVDPAATPAAVQEALQV
jgi:hypothetical protein